MGAILFVLAFWAVLAFVVYLIMQPSPVHKTQQVYAKSVKWIKEVVNDPVEAAGVLAIASIVIAVLGFQVHALKRIDSLL